LIAISYFGAGMYGQLGHNTFENQYLPRKVFDLMGSEVTEITCGRCHTLAYIAATNRLYSFGLSSNGQLGISVTNVNKLTPVVVSGIKLNSMIDKPANPNEKLKFLHSIYTGGDQSFVLFKHVSKYNKPHVHIFFNSYQNE
jgi:E3 ubiquitin-protein ligase HERC4